MTNIPPLPFPLTAPSPGDFTERAMHPAAQKRLDHPEGQQVPSAAAWRPLYDTWATQSHAVTAFFQTGAQGRGEQFTNLVTPGNLAYPRCFSGSGVIIQGNAPLPPGVTATFTIGDEVIAKAELPSIGTSGCEMETDPYFIPTLQNFAVFLHFPAGMEYRTRFFRVTLPGWWMRDRR